MSSTCMVVNTDKIAGLFWPIVKIITLKTANRILFGELKFSLKKASGIDDKIEFEHIEKLSAESLYTLI